MNTTSRPSVSNVLDIRFGPLLPWTFHFVGAIVILIAILIAITHPLIASLFAMASLFIFTSSEGTEIDLKKSRFREYTSVFFIKTGSWVRYDSIEKIYVNKNKMRQRMSPSRAGLTTSFTFSEFSAFLKFNEEEIVQLMKHKNKNRVMERARLWSEQLNIPLFDNAGDDA